MITAGETLSSISGGTLEKAKRVSGGLAGEREAVI